MGMFEVRIKLTGKHGCDASSQPGERLYHRCRRLDCADCRVLDFIQNLRQYGGFSIGEATLTHFAGSEQEIVDDLLTNTRIKGQFVHKGGL